MSGTEHLLPFVGLISLGLYSHCFIIFRGQRGTFKAVVRCSYSPVLQGLPQLCEQLFKSGRSCTSGMGGKAHILMVTLMGYQVYTVLCSHTPYLNQHSSLAWCRRQRRWRLRAENTEIEGDCVFKITTTETNT